MVPKIKLGELLVKENLITNEQLQEALALQKSSGEQLGKILIKTGVITKKALSQFIAQQLKIPLIDLAQYKIDSQVTTKLPENYAKRFQAILLAEEEKSVLVGMVDPINIFAIDELSRILNKTITLAVVDEDELTRVLNLIYRRTEEITDYAKKLSTELKQVEFMENVDQTDTVVSHLIYSVFEDAVQVAASDIHFEPTENTLRIRLRVDGILQEQKIATKDQSIANAISQRLKLMANLNIAEKRLPQDGGFIINVRNIPIDVRLSTMPSQYGESIVMRVLNKSGHILNLNNIGMPPHVLTRFRELIKIPHGMILVTGPTGSGKTTTLYGALAEINDVGKNIITIEDPIEYRLEGLNQVQIHTQLGLTFARVLRAAMRQDPNIILVGEIRDQETAEIAARAALTGHLVMTTLHTNDAASTAIRLLDIGVAGYLVAATVRAALAQRLVKRICKSCATDYTPPPNELGFIKNFFGEEMPTLNLKKGAGCNHCNYTGYQGRIGVFELLEFNKEMLDALRLLDTREFTRVAVHERKSSTLFANALEMANQGITTLSEVLRVAGEQI